MHTSDSTVTKTKGKGHAAELLIKDIVHKPDLKAKVVCHVFGCW